MLKNLIFLAGFSLFVVVAYILVNIFLERTSSTIPPTLQKNLEPIEGTFDTKVLEALKNRTVIPVDLVNQTVIIAETQNIATAGANPAVTISPLPTRIP